MCPVSRLRSRCGAWVRAGGPQTRRGAAFSPILSTVRRRRRRGGGRARAGRHRLRGGRVDGEAGGSGAGRRVRAMDGVGGQRAEASTWSRRRPSTGRPQSAWPRCHHRRRRGHRNTFAADTFTAYLGDHVVFVTVVTDPARRVLHSDRISPPTAGENGVGVTGLRAMLRVHWRRCRTRGRCSSRLRRRAGRMRDRRLVRAGLLASRHRQRQGRQVDFGPDFKVTDRADGHRSATARRRRRCRRE